MDSKDFVIIIAGLLSLAAAYFDWDWFMNDGKARFFSKLVGGRKNGRFFYAGLGLVLIGSALSGVLNTL